MRTNLGRPGLALTTLAALLVTTSLAVAARVPADKSLSEGVYTGVQAERGEKVFQKICVECHLPAELERTVRSFVGLPVSFLFENLRTTMPENNPGGLSRDEYADVLTYIFELNGFPAGDDEMGSDATDLDGIMIDPPPQKGR